MKLYVFTSLGLLFTKLGVTVGRAVCDELVCLNFVCQPMQWSRFAHRGGEICTGSTMCWFLLNCSRVV